MAEVGEAVAVALARRLAVQALRVPRRVVAVRMAGKWRVVT